MANNFPSANAIRAGSTSVSVAVRLSDNTTHLPKTGIAHTDLTSASYIRQGGTRTAITLSALGAVDGAYSAGGWIEMDATNLPGWYRLDVPDAAFATGADWVLVTVADDASYSREPVLLGLTSFVGEAAAIAGTVVEVEGSYTIKQALSIMLAVLAGRTTGGGLTFKTPDNAATRVVATTDVSKNRTGMTLTPSA